MADELVKMWRASFNRALAPYRNGHSIEEQTRFLLETQRQRAVVTVALNEDRTIMGFMAQASQSVEQLYLHVDHQGRGLGAAFLQRAKAVSPMHLHLYTFQRNLKARRFYQRHGFREIGYGFENMEGLADVELEWRATGNRG